MPVKLCHLCGTEFSKNPKYSKTQWNKYLYCSKECRAKVLSTKRKGKKPWNFGLSSWCKGKHFTEEHRKNIGLGNKGKKISEHQKNLISQRQTGVPRPDRAGEKCNFWKGGITPVNKLIRTSMIYRQWRIGVFDRDNFTCLICGQRGGELNADHIKPFATHPDLRFKIDNGRTLCVSCHRKTDTWGGKINRKQIINLIK